MSKYKQESFSNFITGFFNITASEDNNYVYIKHITEADKQLLLHTYSNKIKLFFGDIEREQLLFINYKIPKALAFEMAYMLLGLFEITNNRRYKIAFDNIKNNTWLKNALDAQGHTINNSKLKKELLYNLLPHQEEFVNYYFISKKNRNLRGIMLAFEQGLGKTLTAISISILSNSDQTLIICPNGLRLVWANEFVKMTRRYHNKRNLFEKEVYIQNYSQKLEDLSKKKIIIVNYESINKIKNKIQKNLKKILIVDESHLIKELSSHRTKEIIKLVYESNFENVLLQSGTPIKGSPHELLPMLVVLDKQFNSETLRFYKRFINSDNKNLLSILNQRFNYMAFRKTKLSVNNVLKLKPKQYNNINIEVPNSDKYLITNVKNDIRNRIKEILEKEKPFQKEYQTKIDEITLKYSLKNQKTKEHYSNYMVIINKIRNMEMITDKEKEFRDEFEKIIIKLMNNKDKKYFKTYISRANVLYASALGRAIGDIYINRYKEMIIAITESSIEHLEDILEKSVVKKVIVLTSYPDAVNKCRELLYKKKIKSVTITGATKQKQRLINLQTFAENPNVQFLIGTLEILSVGFTFTHSDSLVFLNQPWRWVDKQQAEDRIHRIGQTNVAKIYTILLKTNKPNLSTRNNEIVEKSKEVFDNIITGGEIKKMESFFRIIK